MPHIPQEIIDAILDDLAGCLANPADWKACALVSKSFRPYSQSVLFRSITIDTEDHSLWRLHTVLEDNPHLGTHVRELVLSITPRDLPDILQPLIMDTLARFTGVTSCIWMEHLLPSESTSETLRRRLYQFLRLPSLVNVAVYGADRVLVHFLASCEQLKFLAVNMPSHYNKDAAILPRVGAISTTRSTPASGLLEALVVNQSYIIDLVHSLTSQSSRLRVSRLRKLTFFRRYGDLNEEKKAFQQALDLCAESLEELTVGKHRHPSPFCYRTSQPNVC